MRQGVQTVSGGPKVPGAQLAVADRDYALDMGGPVPDVLLSRAPPGVLASVTTLFHGRRESRRISEKPRIMSLFSSRRISSLDPLERFGMPARMRGVPAGRDVRPCRGPGPVRKVGTG